MPCAPAFARPLACVSIAVHSANAIRRERLAKVFDNGFRRKRSLGNDLGGVDHLSEGQKQLIRRAATLSIMAEAMEADAVRNLAFDGEAYGVLCDRLGRCLQRLGLERVARPVNDGSQALADYFSRPPPKEAAP